MKMESSQFRMRIPKEIHAILKRVACDENITMTELFMIMFDHWIVSYHIDKKNTKELISEYKERKKMLNSK